MATAWKTFGRRLWGGLQMIPRILCWMLGVLFNRYTAALFLVAGMADVWFETRGLPACLEQQVREQLKKGEISLDFDWMLVGVANGIVLEGVRGQVITPAGPAQLKAKRLAVEVDWLELLQGNILVCGAKVMDGSMDLLDSQDNPSLTVSDVGFVTRLAGDDSLSTTMQGQIQGVRVRAKANLKEARFWLKGLFASDRKPQRDMVVNPVWQRQVAEISKLVSKALPQGSDAQLRLSLSGELMVPLTWQVSGTVTCKSVAWRGLELPLVSCGLQGNMNCLSLNDIRLSLTSLDTFYGQVRIYPLSGEIEGRCDGEVNGLTAVRVYEALNGAQGLTGKTRADLAWMLPLPVRISSFLERSKLSLAGLKGGLSCQITGAEIPVLGRCSGQVKASLEQGMMRLDRALFSWGEQEDERLVLGGSYSLLTGECKGQLTGRVKLNHHLADVNIHLPEALIKLSDQASGISMSFGHSGDGQKGWSVEGTIRQPKLRLLDVPCSSLNVPFSYADGMLKINNLVAERHKRGVLLRGNASCNLENSQKDGIYRFAFQDMELHGTRGERDHWGLALTFDGSLVWHSSPGTLSMDMNGKTYPDRLYQNYLRQWNVDSSQMLMHIDCSTSKAPMSFHLFMPEVSLENDDWRLEGNFSMGNMVFNSLPFNSLSCGHFVITPEYCSFQDINGTTARQDHAELDIRVDYNPFKMTFSRSKLEGDPRIIASFFLSSQLRDIYLKVFEKFTWSQDYPAMLRLPRLVYQEGENWSVTCEGIHIHARNLAYQNLKLDDLNAIVGLDLPHSVTLETISVEKDSWWLGGRMELELQGVRQCRFQVYDTLYGADVKYLLDGLNPKLSQSLKELQVSSDCIASCKGSFFLDGEPRLRLDGKLKANQISYERHSLDHVAMDWSYDAGSVGWQVHKATYLTGAVKTSGIYNLWENQGKILLRFDQVPLDAIHKKINQLPDSKMSAAATHYKGEVGGELQMEVLHGWAGRDWHLNGTGHISVRKAELWEVPLLSALNALLKSATFGWLSSGLGQISELDADVSLLGAYVHVPRLTTNGTIMSLTGSGGYRWTDDWRKGNLHFLVNGIPVRGVKILSFMLSSLTGMFQAELTGTLEENQWKMRTFIDMLF